MSFFALLNITATPNLTTSEAYLSFTKPHLNASSVINNSQFTESLGCFSGSNPVSCNETCGNVTAMLLNWPNFYTCSWYPSVSQTLDIFNVTEDEVAKLDTLGIFGKQQDLANNISSTAAHCLEDYCQSSKECMDLDIGQSCSLEKLINSNGSNAILDQGNAFECMLAGICSSTSDVNPDIGGLGV